MSNILSQQIDFVKSHQLEFFEKHLPTKPYCSDFLPAGLVVRGKQLAMQKRYIQANGPTHLYWLAFDVDRETATFDWEDRRCPSPNIVVTNPDNGHAHLLYGLEVPVRKAPEAQLKPLRYAAAVEYALCTKLDADYGYAGLIVKNPLHKHWKVQTHQESPYSLGWLSEYLPMDKIDYRKKSLDYGLGRNCTVFDSLRHWAYRARLGDWKNLDDWIKACYERAESYNTFQCPLPSSEIRATAKSVGKYTWKNITYEGFSLIQSYRGKKGGIKSGEVRKEKADVRKQLILAFDGLSTSEISEKTGIPSSTIRRLKSQIKQ